MNAGAIELADPLAMGNLLCTGKDCAEFGDAVAVVAEPVDETLMVTRLCAAGVFVAPGLCTADTATIAAESPSDGLLCAVFAESTGFACAPGVVVP